MKTDMTVTINKTRQGGLRNGKLVLIIHRFEQVCVQLVFQKGFTDLEFLIAVGKNSKLWDHTFECNK